LALREVPQIEIKTKEELEEEWKKVEERSRQSQEEMGHLVEQVKIDLDILSVMQKQKSASDVYK